MTLLCTQTRVTTPGTTLSGTTTTPWRRSVCREASPPRSLQRRTYEGKKKKKESRKKKRGSSTFPPVAEKDRDYARRDVVDRPSFPRKITSVRPTFNVSDDDPLNVKIAAVIRARLSINVCNNGRRSREAERTEGSYNQGG